MKFFLKVFVSTWLMIALFGHGLAIGQTGNCPVDYPDDYSLDITPPVITAPAHTTVSSQFLTQPQHTGYATATDNCMPGNQLFITYTDNQSVPWCAGYFQITRTWKATDAGNNSATAVQIILVDDKIAPVFTACAPNLTVATPVDIPPVNLAQLSATDNNGGDVGISLYSETYEGLDIKVGFCPTKVIRTYRATDDCGNFSECVQIITVQSVANCGPCKDGVPFVYMDLSASPTATMTTEDIRRQSQCCGAKNNMGCVSFNILLHPDAIGLRIKVDGATPQPHEWKIDCDDISFVGDIICLPPGLFRTFTFCKPGANKNQFTITSIPGTIVSDDFTTRTECTNNISVIGAVPSSIVFEDITGNGAFLKYLSNPSGSATTTFRADAAAPPLIKYRVCGTLTSGVICGGSGTDCDTITIRVIPEITAQITSPPNFCVTDLNTVSINVLPLIGTYFYTWRNSNGLVVASGTDPTFQPATPGNYTVTVKETSLGLPCDEATFPFVVTLDYEVPTLLFSGQQSICPGQTATWNLPVSGGTTVSGSLMPGNIAFSGQPPLISIALMPQATTTYHAAGLVIDGCAVPLSPTDARFTVMLPNGQHGLWTGAFDDNWFDCRNWADGILPNINTDVVLPLNAANNVNIDGGKGGPALCRNILIQKPFSFTTQGILHIYGNWSDELSQSFVPGNGTVVFSGEAEQLINTTAQEEVFANVTLQKTPNTQAILQKPVLINATGVFTIVSGIWVTSSQQMFTVTNTEVAAVVRNSNQPNDAYVCGPMQRHMDALAEYLFPVGKLGAPYINYRPIAVLTNAAKFHIFSAEYHPSTPPNPTSWGGLLGGILNREYWYVSRIAGAEAARVKLFYITPTASNHWIFNQPKHPQALIFVAKYYVNELWYFTGEGAGDPYDFFEVPLQEAVPFLHNNTMGEPIYSRPLSEFSPFTFGFHNAIVLPVEFVDFFLQERAATVRLLWQVAMPELVDRYEIEHSTNGVTFRVIDSIIAAKELHYQSAYPLPAEGNHYYRIKLIKKEGGVLYSPVKLYSRKASPQLLRIMQNPVQGNSILYQLQVAGTQKVRVQLFDFSGRAMGEKILPLSQGVHALQWPLLPGLPPGVYYLRAQVMGGSQSAQERVVL